MLKTEDAMEASALADWARGFAQETLPVCDLPPVEVIRQAIAAHLPHKLEELSKEAKAAELLEQVLGIAVIVQFGREKIGWTATTDPVEAEELGQLYSEPPFSQARHALGIDGQWILLGHLQFLNHYHTEDLYEHGPAPLEIYEQFPEVFRLEDRQECVVVKL